MSQHPFDPVSDAIRESMTRRQMVINQGIDALRMGGDNRDTWRRIEVMAARWARGPGYRSAVTEQAAKDTLVAEIRITYVRVAADIREHQEHEDLRRVILAEQQAEGLA